MIVKVGMPVKCSKKLIILSVEHHCMYFVQNNYVLINSSILTF